MRLARQLRLPVASVETTEIGGRKLIVVERFDRVVAPDGAISRLHQEDFCQATATPPLQKYEEDGGPSLRRIASILQTAATNESTEAFLRAVTLNLVLGNGDAHAKNYSLLYESGVIRLAPLYDLVSTLHYGDDRLAMFIDNARRTSRVTLDRLLNEAVSWGMSRRRAADVVEDVLARTPAAAESAATSTPGLPAGIPDVVHSQLRKLRQQG